MTESEKMLLKFLHHNKSAIHPGRGKENAKLVRQVCELLNLDEDKFLDRFVVKDKSKWGLK